MNKSLWIFDYDQTLMPVYISNIINNNIINILEFNHLIVILINIIIIINYIKNELNGEIIILTASIEPWVEMSLHKADNILKNNKHLIDYNIIKNYVIYFNYNKINNILNTNDFFTKYIKNTINNIVYVHNIENSLGNNERYNKNNSLQHIIYKYEMYNNIIILGDAHDNERKHAIDISKKNNNKVIKFIQFSDTYDNIIKIHEQHLLFNNLKHMYYINENVIYDIIE